MKLFPLLAVLILGALPALATPTKPNVLLIISDDQGFGDLSLHGNPRLQTPHLDAFARSAAQLTHFYVSPVCAPTRAAVLTGRYPLRTGTWGVARGQETMRASEITLAEVLRDAGWRTGLFGKWHNGEHFPNDPNGQGFEEFFGFTRGHWNNYFDTTLTRNGHEEKTHGYLQDLLSDEAIRFLEAHREQPFFCQLAYNTPHSPFQVPDAYFDKYKAMGMENDLACIYGMVANMDDNIGRVLARLDALGLSKNTIVIFMSDNGPNTFRFNAGMKGKKGGVDEGSVRVPCFIRWPEKIAPSLLPQIAAHIDLLPTLLEMCGVPAPAVKLDGQSLAPLLLGQVKTLPERTLFVQQVQGERSQPYPGAARTQTHRAVNVGKAWQLFDMEADPGQTRDIAAQQPGLLRDLSTAYDAWWKEVAPAQFESLPIPVGFAGHDRVELTAAEVVEMPGLKFSCKHPNNAWITGWTGLDSHVTWRLEVARAGTYRVTLQYLSQTAGSRLRVRANETEPAPEITLEATPFVQVPSPDRSPRDEVQEMEWVTKVMGEVRLEAGINRLQIDGLEKPGAELLQLKAVVLEMGH